MSEPTAGPNGRPTFIRARTAAGLGGFLLVGVLYVFDFVSPEFAVDSVQLGLLLGTSSLLLGVEAIRKGIGGPS